MKALIVEDEIYNFNALRSMLLDVYPQTEIVGPVVDLAGLERAMQEQSRYDVIYCDIRLEDGICFSVFENMDVTIPVIFTTAYSEYALKAFEANGIAYLLKPISREALRKATDKVLAMKFNNQNIVAMLESIGMKGKTSFVRFLKANTYDGALIINVTDVNCFMVDGKSTFAMMSNGTKNRIGYTLDGLMQRLDPMQFFRANRQFIVNRNAIYCIRNYGIRQVLLKIAGYDDIQVLVSKENIPVLNAWIEQ
ncbi:LytTR family DNA-binding domain-containing protein [Bacteroides caecigallinarum]|nr:LytTR family DNA-binding domain-containing protein [Bacteroides caecigallinarum]